MEIPASGLRLNLGCGRHTMDGWCNVDAAPSPQASREPDILCDVRAIPLPDACASEILAVHLFEHLYRWECDDVIEEWKRLLRPGAIIAMEMPDLLKTCNNILQGATDSRKFADQLGLWSLYGDPRERLPLMVHRWAWTFGSIKPFLVEHGFIDIKEERTQWHPVGRDVRDFRVTARKA